MSDPEVGARRAGSCSVSAVGAGTQPVIDAAVLAAIVAAVDATWPRSMVGAQAPEPFEPTRWRFSSRWWSSPVASRRSRPW